MRTISTTTAFRKDARRMSKRGRPLADLEEAVQRLADGDTLAPHYRDHVLAGQYQGARECHLEPDWLLIYERTETELILIRTGSHADLFQL